MADKTIGELPGVTSLDSDSLFVAQQQGVASKVTGAQLTRFANVETAAQVAAAQAAAEGAAASETAAETAKNGAETAQTAIENMTVEAETLAAGAQATVQKIVTSGQPIKLLFGLPTGPTGPAGGVNTFNGRTGAVMPAAGDYTAGMVGAAPDGYGLGTGFANAPGLDANQIVANGVYAASKNVPIEGVTYIVDTKVGTNGQNQIQYAYAYRPSSGAPTASTVQRRICDSGNWGAWEWINPPMLLVVEYRTVERYNGNPVYATAVNCGVAVDGAKSVAHGSANVGSIVSATPQDFTVPGCGPYGDGSNALFATADAANITVYARGSYVGHTVRVVIKYTKATN